MDPTPAGLITKKGVGIPFLGIPCVAPQAVSQQKPVTGKVTSEQGAPLSGGSVKGAPCSLVTLPVTVFCCETAWGATQSIPSNAMTTPFFIMSPADVGSMGPDVTARSCRPQEAGAGAPSRRGLLYRMGLLDSKQQSAAGVVLLLGVAILIALSPYVTGLVGIPVLYAVFAPVQQWLARRMREQLAAVLVVALALFLIVVPGGSFAGLVAGRAQQIAGSVVRNAIPGLCAQRPV